MVQSSFCIHPSDDGCNVLSEPKVHCTLSTIRGPPHKLQTVSNDVTPSLISVRMFHLMGIYMDVFLLRPRWWITGLFISGFAFAVPARARGCTLASPSKHKLSEVTIPHWITLSIYLCKESCEMPQRKRHALLSLPACLAASSLMK